MGVHLLKNWRRLTLLLAAVLSLTLCAPLAAAAEEPWELTAAEEAYIKSKDVLRVALVDNWPPFSSRTERNGTPKGLTVDILRQFQNDTGIPISYTVVGTYLEAIRMAESGEVDVAAVVKEFDYAKSGFDLRLSRPYLTSQLMVIHNKGDAVMNRDFYLLAQVAGFPKFSDNPEVSPMSFETVEDCLMAVRSRHARMMVSDVYSGVYYIQRYENRNLDVTPINAQAHFRFGVYPGEDLALVRLLDRTVANMGRSAINHSLSYSPISESSTVWDFVYYYPFETICVVLALAFLITLVSITYMRVHGSQSLSAQGYEKSYLMLADTLGQAGLNYDYLEDRLTIFGKYADTLSLPREIENFSAYLEQEDRSVSLTKGEFQKLLSDGMTGKRCDAELSCRLQDGHWHHFRLFFTVLSTDESYQRPVRLVGCLASAESDFQQKEELIQMSLYDQLTGLRNRFGAERKLQRIYASGADTRRDLVLLVDIDHFKSFNDAQGHDCGDDVLQTIGHQLRVTFRSEDMLCRWGGDEFMLYLPGAADHLDAVRARCDAIRQELRRHRYKGEPLPITLSIGGVRVGSRTIEEAREAADRAMYVVKELGRDGIHILVDDPEEEP